MERVVIKMMILTVGVFGLIMLVMAVGVIFQGKTLRGSCGGVGGSCACDDAGEPVCERKKAHDEQSRDNLEKQGF